MSVGDQPATEGATESVAPRARSKRAAIYSLILIIMGIIVAVMSSLGPERLVLVVLLVVIAPLVMGTVELRVKDPGAMQAGFSTVMSALVTLVVPDLWAAGLVLMMASGVALAATGGVRWATVVVGLSAVVMIGAGTAHQPDGYPLGLLALLVFPALIVGLDETHRRRQRHGNLVKRVRHAVIVAAPRRSPSGRRSPRLVDINPAAEQMFDIDGRQVVGGDLGAAIPSLASAGVLDALVEILSGQEVSCAERFRLNDDLVVDAEMASLPGGEASLMLIDVTEQVRAERSILHRAEHDGLTGIANRAALVEQLSDRLDGDRRRMREFALLILDLNRFKEVNDTFGHDFGDQVLRSIAQRLHAAARPSDFVARLGGDEFAVIIDEPDGLTNALEVAERFGRVCDEPTPIDGLAVTVGVAIGLALVPEDGVDVATVMRRADRAMYEAKRSGDRVRAYAPVQEIERAKRVALTAQISEGLGEDQFIAYAQTKVNLTTCRVDGLEVLSRWRHPTLGLVSPSEFIDLMEIGGYSGLLTRIVLDAGVKAAAAVAPEVQVKVAVNVSARDLGDPALVDAIQELLHGYETDAGRLTIEVTESQMIEEIDVVESSLLRLDEIGVDLAIDDFGTGHSSLSRLHRLPVAEIKIDQSFVQKLRERPDDDVIVRSIISLAHNLGATTTAEGIEGTAEAALLRDLGCDMGQGFFFSEPLPIDEAIPLVGTVFVPPKEPRTG